MNRRIAALALAAGLLCLTACAAEPGGGATPSISADQAGDDGQSVAEGCAIVQDTITAAADEFESAAAGDPASVVEGMRAAAETLVDVATQVTNDDVAAVIPELESMFTEVAEIMQAIVDGDVSKVGDLRAVGEEFQDTTARFQELCAA